MIKTKSKRLLGVLLSAALLASMALPSGVTAAEVGEAVGVTSATATEATSTDTATEEVTTIAEVSETAATVDSAEVVEEDEEVTVIDEVSETAETVETVDASGYYTYSLYENATLSASYDTVGTAASTTYTVSSSAVTQTGIGVRMTNTETLAAADSFFGAKLSGVTFADYTSAGDGIYFEIYDVNNTWASGNMIEAKITVNGTTYGAVNANGRFSKSAQSGLWNSTTSYTVDSSASSTIYYFYIPYTKFTNTSSGNLSAATVTAAASFDLSISIRGNDLTGTAGENGTRYLVYDNIGIYSASDLTIPINNYSSQRSAARTANDVKVVQTFDDAINETTVTADGGGSVSYSIPTDGTYADGTYALYKVANGPYNLRMQTDETQLMGEGLYFEVYSSNPGACLSTCRVSIYDSSSADKQSSEDVRLGDEVLPTAVATYGHKVSDDSDSANYVYYVMIPWSAFGDVSGELLSNGLSVKVWLTGTVVEQTLAIDNIGFYGISDTLGGAVQGVTDDSVEVSATIASGYGTDTVYALVDNTAGTYSNDDGDGVYPTTSLSYSDNGYIFAGWYSYTAGDTSYTKMETVPTGEAYAKFVDADMLQIGFQTADGDNSTFMLRLVSTVDCLDYSQVGFLITLSNGNGTATKDLNDTIVYQTIYVTAGDSSTELTANTTFSSVSQYFSTAVITGISISSTYTIYSVYAYVVTADGTTVVYTTPTSSITGGVTYGVSGSDGTSLADLYTMTQKASTTVDGSNE